MWWLCFLPLLVSGAINLTVPPGFPATPEAMIRSHLAKVSTEYTVNIDVVAGNHLPEAFSTTRNDLEANQ